MDNSQKAFICGWPVEHSRSPVIHNYWLEKFNISGEYVKHPVPLDDFSIFIESLQKDIFIGGNVTIPHKEKAFKLIENLDPVALRLGAVNTIWLENNIVHGANTDGYGYLANLDQQAPDWDSADRKPKTVIILGAGGAARAIVDAIKSRGFTNICIVNRTFSKAEALVGHFGSDITAHHWEDLPNLMQSAGLLINTTSLGMVGKQPLNIDLDPLPSHCLVSDIVYVPLQTRLLKQASRRELKTVDGLGMLLHQAVPGFEKWFGVRPEVTEELRALVIRDMEANP